MSHPPFERLGFRLAGTENEGIEAGFGNKTEGPACPRVLLLESLNA